MIVSMMKQPSALIPLAMSLTTLCMVLVHYAMFGIDRAADEGSPAHIFQLLLVAQLPIVAFFAAKWLPRGPEQALKVLALQAGAGLAAMAAEYFLT